MKTALICGISGQDGSYLAAHLLSKGYRVIGTSRDAQVSSMTNLDRLGVRSSVEVTSMALNDFRSVLQVLTRVRPHEVYNLGGQSSVGLSFEQPVETLESISVGTLNLLEGLRFLGSTARLYNAGSSEYFGETGSAPASETTPPRPRAQDKLTVGNLEIHRDWGWAPAYVDAMWRMLQQDQPIDIRHGAADPALARQTLGWAATLDVDGVVAEMCRAAEAHARRLQAIAR